MRFSLVALLIATVFGYASANGCCSLDYRDCITWCGDTEESCNNCSNPDVGWLPNGAPTGSCLNRWTDCGANKNGCCDGLTCQFQNNYFGCFPGDDVPVPNPTNPPVPNPTNAPVPNPTNLPVPNPTNPPAQSPTKKPSTPKCKNSREQFTVLVGKKNRERKKKCGWVKNDASRCEKETVDKQLVKDLCPKNCNNCSTSPVPNPTNPPVPNPTNPPVPNPTNPPVPNPTNPPVPSPTNPPNTDGCCSHDYKTCVDWCGPTYDNCMNCGDVVWLPQGNLDENCGPRWSGCEQNNDLNHNGCCGGLTCQWRDGYGYMACLPDGDGNNNPAPTPPNPNPTDVPVSGPTDAPQPTPTMEPFNGELLSTNKAMNAWEVYKGLERVTQKNSENPPKYAFVASGGAAGGGGSVVSEGQAYGLLITGTVLASWDTHAGNVPGANRAEVLTSFEGYYNFWKEMCKNSSANTGSNCQPNGKFCRSGSDSYVCLPDWKHRSGGGSEATGPAPDGDEDAIVGIMLAVGAVANDATKPSWYDEARKWADASATALFTFEVDKSKPDFRLLKLGSCWGGWESAGNNPSYHSPGSYRVMKDYQDSFPDSDRVGYDAVPQSEWTKLIDTSYGVLEAVQCSNDGALVPNWATVGVNNNGKIVHTGGSFSGSGTGQYEYGAEAARTTFRVALDAALYPEKASEWSPYLSEYNYRLEEGFDGNNDNFSSGTFPNCRGPNTNSNIYMFGDWQNNAFIYGPTYSALIGAPPGVGEAMIDAAGKFLGEKSLPDSYYPRSWAMIANLMLNGAMESAGNTLKSGF